MKKIINILFYEIIIVILMFSCKTPPPEKSIIKEKHNYIVLLDLSDRIIVQDEQISRDKDIIKHIYSIFEERVKKNLYLKSRDEMKVVIAPQKGSDLKTENFEDRLYLNMKNIDIVKRRKMEGERKSAFYANVDTLYKMARFSDVPEEYYGADIWKYFYENLKADYSTDTLTDNYLFILTDGYPVVGEDNVKLQPLKEEYANLHVILVEASPWDKDMEWDHVTKIWSEWFDEIGIKQFTLIKRSAISKEKEQISAIINGN